MPEDVKIIYDEPERNIVGGAWYPMLVGSIIGGVAFVFCMAILKHLHQ